MNRLLGVGLFVAAMFASLVPGRIARAQFEELVQRVPSSANAMILVDVEKTLTSPVGLEKKWSEKVENAYASGITFLPVSAKRAILASHVDLELSHPMWQMAAMDVSYTLSALKVAQFTGGSVDYLGKHEAVGLPGGAFAVIYSPHVVGILAPANRQVVSRWVNETDARTGPALSPYLNEAYQYANVLGTPIIIALDLEGAVSVDRVRQAMDESEVKAALGSTVNIDDLAAVVAGIRGVMLGVTLADKPFGKIKVDFSQPLTLSPTTGKALLLHAIGKRGLMLDELVGWAPKVSGNQLTLEGYLTDSGMRRIASLFDKPPALAPPPMAPAALPPETTPESLKMMATKSYFQQVTQLLDDLREKPDQSGGAQTMGLYAKWFENYARKIDQLSVVNVDTDMADFGASAADSLRQACSALQSGAAQSRIRQVNVPMQYNYYTVGSTYGYNFWGPVGEYGTVAVQDTAAYAHEKTRVRTEERVSSASDARTIMQQLQASSADVRRKMEQKYGVAF